MWAFSLGALPPPNSHWTSYVYADYSQSLTLRWSCLKKRERWGWKCFLISERLYGKAQKKSTVLSDPISLSVPLLTPHTTMRALEHIRITVCTEDCNSFEMHRMTVMTVHLLHIAKATGSKIYTRDSESKVHGWAKTLVLSLKQYHAHYNCFYKKEMTRAMVGLQGLHSSDAFRCSNMSSSVGLKPFCPWCFKLGGQHWDNSHTPKRSALLVGHHLWLL